MESGKYQEQIAFIERMRLLGAIKIKVDTVEVEFKVDTPSRIDPERLVQGISQIINDNEMSKETREEIEFWSAP